MRIFVKVKVIAVLSILLFIVADLRSQQQWKYLETTNDGTTISLSIQKNISKSHNIIRVWEKYNDVNPNTKRGTMIDLSEFDCDNQKFRTISYKNYHPDGSLAHSSDSVSKWEYVYPGSIAEDIMNYLCNGKLPNTTWTDTVSTSPSVTAPATPPPPPPAETGPRKIQIEIQENPDGNIPGDRLIYKIKELIRSSSRYEINYGTGARWVLSIATIDRDCSDKNISTFYSWVLRVILPNPNYLDDDYIDASSGFCGQDVIQSSAEAIVANIDKDIDAVIHTASTK